MPNANPSKLQLRADGRLRHLLTLHGMDPDLLAELLDRAESMLSTGGGPVVRSDTLRGKTVANLFFESSTRTRASFELAAKRMGADVINLDIGNSSTTKGESVLDTIYTLQAMQVDVFVVRAGEPGTQSHIAQHIDDHVSVLNAGESNVSHPTQGLLDLLTIRRHKGAFENLTVTIVGDVAHSRVARSAADGLLAMGVGELRLVSPPSLAPDPATMPGATILTDLNAGLSGADVVMALRIQKERIKIKDGIPDGDAYFRDYGISHERMKLASPDAIVMHPGPMNRGVEIESALADSASSVITEQVTNGIAVRMAVLDAVAGQSAQ